MNRYRPAPGRPWPPPVKRHPTMPAHGQRSGRGRGHPALTGQPRIDPVLKAKYHQHRLPTQPRPPGAHCTAGTAHPNSDILAVCIPDNNPDSHAAPMASTTRTNPPVARRPCQLGGSHPLVAQLPRRNMATVYGRHGGGAPLPKRRDPSHRGTSAARHRVSPGRLPSQARLSSSSTGP